MTKMSDAEIQASLSQFPDWSELNGAIQRTFQFADFCAAMGFVNRVADAAERGQHHPDVLIRYNKVTMTLSSNSIPRSCCPFSKAVVAACRSRSTSMRRFGSSWDSPLPRLKTEERSSSEKHASSRKPQAAPSEVS